MFVRNCWYVAAWSRELGGVEMISRRIIGEPLLIYRLADGSITAMQDRCPHRQAPLSLGRREGDDVRCMYHGLKFSPSGTCIAIPAQAAIPPQAAVRRYAAIERHSWIWVWMGDPCAADDGLIPPAVGLDDPAWTLHAGTMDYDARYTLLNDNLCDFSHVSYVHASSFAQGAAQNVWADVRPRITYLPRGIRVERWLVNSPPPPYAKAFEGLFDRWTAYEYLVPGILLMTTQLHSPGTAAAADFHATDARPAHANITSQAVTPITADRTRYFFSMGPRSEELRDTPQFLHNLVPVMMKAFAEDRTLIEAQHLNIDPHFPQISIMHDRGPLKFQQLIDRMIADEQNDTPLNRRRHTPGPIE